MSALSPEQRAKAILRSGDKAGDLNLTEAWKDNVVLDYAGVPATALSASQREQLLNLIGLYVGAMDDGHARVKMADVRAHSIAPGLRGSAGPIPAACSTTASIARSSSSSSIIRNPSASVIS